MLIVVEGANCRCLHFCFLVVNALNLFLVQVPCTWTEFEVVALQCDKVLVIDLEEVAVFSCDMTSLGK